MSKPIKNKVERTLKNAKVKYSTKKPILKAKTPLTAGTTAAVRFGSVGENAMIYLKEGVENKISELQLAIATKEESKKAALEALEDLEDLQSDCSMSDIRQRLNAVVGSLQDLFNVL